MASSASGFEYQPDFITPAEEETLLATIGRLAGVGWHRDMPDFAVIAGISLAAPARMRFRPYPPRKVPARERLGIELEPRSAYVMRNDVRWQWQHSIAPTEALRYSITLRTLLEQ